MSDAANLKAWRKARRWTQAQAAEHIGTSTRTWNAYEKGRPVPRVVLLAIGVSDLPPAPLGSDYG